MRNNRLGACVRHVLLLAIILFAGLTSKSQIITTIAGQGGSGYNGDGIAATAATLFGPVQSVIDGSGNIYIADADNFRVRKINTSGIITTVAGNGIYAHSGDGGPATAASFNRIFSIALGLGGTLLVGTEGAIRRVTSSGIITTIAGNGHSGFAGDGGPASAASLSNVNGIAVDGAGTIYFSDRGNNRIRKITVSDTISTIAGTGTSGFSGDGGAADTAKINSPYGMVLNASGEIFFSDYGNSRVRKISSVGIISTVAGSGAPSYGGDGRAATAAAIYGPCGICFDQIGNLYIATKTYHRVRKVDTAGTITTLAGNGTDGYNGDGMAATASSLGDPTGVMADTAGNIFVCDSRTNYGNNRLRKINASGTISTVAGFGHPGYRGDGGAATAAQLKYPEGICADTAGNLYIADGVNGRVRKVSPGGIITTFAGNGTLATRGDGGPATAAEINEPGPVCTDRRGNVYISQYDRIRKVALSGIISTYAGGGSSTADGVSATTIAMFAVSMAVDSWGNLFYVDPFARKVRKIDTFGIVTTVAGNGASGYTATGVAATATPTNAEGVYVNDSGAIYVTDGPRILIINSAGIISVFAGMSGAYGYSGDGGLATAAACGETISVTGDYSGNVYFSDLKYDVIRKVDTAGIISTYIGLGYAGYSGDGGPATAGALNLPTNIYADGRGRLYICDRWNDAIRMVEGCRYAGPISGRPVICLHDTATLHNASATGLWRSSDTSIARINPATGIVTGFTGGTTTMSCVVNSVCGYDTSFFALTVQPLPVAGPVTGLASVCPHDSIALSDTSGGGRWVTTSSTIASVNPTTGVVTGCTAGTASINYIISNSCGADTATHAITVGAPPVVGPITGRSTLCVGDTATLHDTTTHGAWGTTRATIASVNSATGLVIGGTAGTASIHYIVSNSCGADTATHTITVGAPPVVGTITGRDSICIGDTTTLRGTTALGVWGTTNAAVASINTMGVVTATAGGSATLWYTASNSCGADTAFHSIWVKSITECTTGLTVLAGNTTTNLSIFPNPTTGTFTLRLTTPADEEATVTITNVLGQKVWTQAFTSNRDVAVNFDVAAGMYLVQVMGKNGLSAVAHLVKE